MTSPSKLNLHLKNLLLTGLVGWITSLYTLWHRSKLLAGLDIGESFCNLSSTVNCDNVALSKYSEILGISVPTYGLIFFSIATLLAMRALRQHREGGVGSLTFKLLSITAGVGLITSLGLGLLSLTQIGSFCLVCGVIYLLCFWNCYLVWKLKKLHNAAFVQDVLSTKSLILYAVFVVAQFGFQPLGDFAAKAEQIPEEEIPTELLTQIKNQFSLESAFEIPFQMSPVSGPSEAPITLVEFSDFECPHCAQNFKNMPRTLSRFQKQVKVVYKNFPLDPACNTGGSHRKACFAARASRCVYKKLNLESFKEIQKYLFENRESFNKESVLEKALALGMTQEGFSSCVESAEVYQEIKEEIEMGKSLGVQSTPAIFVNGKQLKMGTNPIILKAILQDLL